MTYSDSVKHILKELEEARKHHQRQLAYIEKRSKLLKVELAKMEGDSK